MKLRDILTEKAIIAELVHTDKKGVLSEFANLAKTVLPDVGVSSEEVLDILLNREKLGSTAVGHGVAIPHGKIPGLNKIVALFGRSREGVEFQSHDQEPTNLFFVLLAPEAAIGNYLHALARLSRLMKDENVRRHIADTSSENLYSILLSEDEKI